MRREHMDNRRLLLPLLRWRRQRPNESPLCNTCAFDRPVAVAVAAAGPPGSTIGRHNYRLIT